MRIYSNKKRPVKASNDGRKWVNTELTQDEYAKFRNFLKKKGYKYETSGAGDMVHIEAYLNEAEIKEADNFLDTLDDVNASNHTGIGASEDKRDPKFRVDIYQRNNPDALITREYKRFKTEDEAKNYGRSISEGNEVVVNKVNESTRRRSVKASRTLEIFTFDELTPEQQEYVLSNWSNMNKLSNRIYEWYNEDLMLSYPDEIQYIADQYASKYGLSINPDKIYWQESSQGPYPEWDLSQVFDEYQLNDGTEIYFYGSGLDVEAETDSWGEEVESPEIDEVVGHAQEFINEVWGYIESVCQSYPDDEWVRGEFEANPDAWEFTVGADGIVKYY